MGELLVLESGRRAYFSASIPPDLRALLDRARTVTDERESESLLLEARRLWAEFPDVHIVLYKHYFVYGHYNKAEAAAWRALRLAAERIGCYHNYRRVHAGSADWSLKDGAERLYLFTLKAMGVIRLRRGRVLQSRQVLEKLLELDPVDEIGGGAFLGIARECLDEDDDDAVIRPALPARAARP